eukprot:CAMPEP_0172379330 /NCGR_PEP_ID=MMETSP1060-20121228/69874_1 /TAXON_ID=37318 /ORGANISM="Pseudo-nitzschia pungens, Strain cf. cingulata" /LENGTH=331 /DNA_ID=CAMNT_0013107069 /DNA_START=522 /DNA_END=1518 /DNA_ORIENTATION=+
MGHSTNPKERGFDYLSGVKRQAGQEKSLVTGSFHGDGTGEENTDQLCDNYHRRSLDHLEKTALMKKREERSLTEIEELEQIRQLNEVSASVNDADMNASIRKVFRRDRKEKRKRLGDAKEKGWRKGMMLLPSNEHDILAANDACYGRPAEDEKRRLSSVRKSSIFSSNVRGSDRKRGRTQSSSSRCEATDTTTNTSNPSPVRSANVVTSNESNARRAELAMAAALTATNPVVDEICSDSYPVNGRTKNYQKKKQTLQLRLGESGLSVLGKVIPVIARKETNSDNDFSDRETITNSSPLLSSAPKTRVERGTKPPSSLSEMMMAYDSGDDSC